MSATNHTSTIELSQYISTDKPTYLTDYNGDMLKIDNAIAADRDSIATAQLTANTADGKADINKTSIDSLNVQLNGDPEDPTDVGVAGDLNALEGTVNTVTALLGNGSPTTSDQTVIGAINGLEGAIAPREDAAALANSYSIGDQFARGGSVYEALASLTAGTAFASLVLNTDYKVADTLVEQIANKDVLPEGYYLSAINQTVNLAPDGTKTIAEMLNDLAVAFMNAINALNYDAIVEITSFQGNGEFVPKTGRFYRKNASYIFTTGDLIELSAGASQLTISSAVISSSTGSVAHGKVKFQNATPTYTDDSSQTASIAYYVKYNIYRAF
jgi:hypothetical protein